MELEELYQQLIIDHFKKPRCYGQLENPSAQCALYNPLCGDRISLSISLNGGKVNEIAFSGHGCSISQAAASMMSELLKGKSIEEVKELSRLYQSMIKGEKSGDELVVLGDSVALQGVRKFSARIKCAMLAWEAVDRAIAQCESENAGR